MIARLKQFFDPGEQGDDSDKTLVNSVSTDQLARLEQQVATLTEVVAGFEKQLSRLSKEQFRTNALTEDALAEAKAARGGPSDRSMSKPATTSPSNTRLLEALMPVLDSIEAGLQSGQVQCERITDDSARETLLAWLDGQRLLRERLLTLLDKENVRPIQTVGQAFDPYRHVAVETAPDPGRPAGTIIEERRRGYESDGRVLRFAEVVVSQHAREA